MFPRNSSDFRRFEGPFVSRGRRDLHPFLAVGVSGSRRFGGTRRYRGITNRVQTAGAFVALMRDLEEESIRLD